MSVAAQRERAHPRGPVPAGERPSRRRDAAAERPEPGTGTGEMVEVPEAREVPEGHQAPEAPEAPEVPTPSAGPTGPPSGPTHGDQSYLPITLIVAPTSGRLRILPPRKFWKGHEWIEAGQPVVRIERGEEFDLVIAPRSGRLGGVLGRDGEPVKAGQAVAWMESE